MAYVLGIGDRVMDDILKEDLEDTMSLFLDETRDALHTTTMGERTNGGLVDSLDVVTKELVMTCLAAPFLSPFPPFLQPDMLFVSSLLIQ